MTEDIVRAVTYEVLEMERLQVSQKMVLVSNPPCIVKDTFQGSAALPGLEGVLPLGQRPSMRKATRADVDVLLVELRPVLRYVQSDQACRDMGCIFQRG